MSESTRMDLANEAFDLLGGDGGLSPQSARMDLLLRALAQHIIDERPADSMFDLPTVAGLVDGSLDDEARTAAEADLQRNPRKLEQYIELAAVQRAFEEDSGSTDGAEPSPDLHFAPPPVAPVIDLAERRSQRRWIAGAASIAAALLVGLFLLVPGGSGLPGPVSLDVLSTGPTVRSGAWIAGEELPLVASLDADAEWAVIAVAAATDVVPVRVWIAASSALGSPSERRADGGLLLHQPLALPPGQRAFLLVASNNPMTQLPALAPGWEASLRTSGRDPELFARDLQSIVDAEAGDRAWRVSRATTVSVAEPDPLGP